MSGSERQAPLRGTDLKRFHRQIRRDLQARQRRVAFVLEHVGFAVNVGSFFRIADACDAELVALVGSTPLPDESPTIRKVGRGRHKRVPWQHFDTVAEAAELLRERGFGIYAVEITAEASAYDAVDFAQRSAFVLGSEDHGVTRAALEVCDRAIYLPMLGRGASLNVHVAGAVVAYRALLQKPEPGD